ncbi:uncharacterized protein LOC141608550 [Silene latifolia]|uniref:uncharacterized protein LOC141608550 n=1 Tax=Silene latifolia TaxID=37657 RepID=UPI003D771D7E
MEENISPNNSSHWRTFDHESDDTLKSTSDEEEAPFDKRIDQGNPTDEEVILQLTEDDVSAEIEYWRQAVVCFIMGANPPSDIVEVFIRRIWSKYNIDKISFMHDGLFLVRFKSLEMKEKVLKSGHYLFDNKPLIVKGWTCEADMTKDTVTTVPVWIKLHKLPLKFWGKGLPKIANLIGNFIKGDLATEEKTRLNFARVMIELKVNQQLPGMVKFKDELGQMIKIDVEYEWKPITCAHCKGVGHETLNCRWRIQAERKK